MVYSGFKIFKWQKENMHNDDIKEKINSAVSFQDNNKYKVDFESLKKQNNDTVAWIKVNNTNTEFNNDSEFEKFIKTLKQRSIKNFNTDVSKNDKIITLSTCAGNDNYRVVLHAKKC